MIDVVAAILIKDNKILIAKRKLKKSQGESRRVEENIKLGELIVKVPKSAEEFREKLELLEGWVDY